MKKNTYKKIMAMGMTMCLLTGVTACGSSEDDYYGEEISYSDEWETEEGEENTEYSEETSWEEGGEVTEGEVAGAVLDFDVDYPDGFPYEEEELGVTFMLPKEFIDAQGFMQFECTDVTGVEGIYYAQMNYTGIPMDQIEAMFAGDDISDEDAQRFSDCTVPVFTLVGATGNRSMQDIIDYVKIGKDLDLVESNFSLLQTIDDYSIYQYKDGTPANYNNIDDSLKAEYDGLVAVADDMLLRSKYVRPVTGAEKIVGTDVSFVTTDLDGNPVSSEDIFGNYDVTMINVWATWCGFCVGELEDLERINKAIGAKNCAIVGMCSDAWDDAKKQEAKEILQAYGVTYYNICPYDGWDEVFEMTGWPSNFFVGKDGKMAAPPIYGAKVDKYEPYIDEILSGNVTTVVQRSNSYANQSGAYNFYVVDEAGNPVEGAMVQFCSDSTCKIQQTDANGMATFKEAPGNYEVHLAKVPDGYKQNTDTYNTDSEYSDMVITVQKQ